jgi:DNA polymerase-3 subunit epsilon
MREIILDTETTGLDPKSGHRVIEIACVEMVDRSLTGNIFHHYFNPQRAIPAEATAIHGITDDFVKDMPTFKMVAQDFFNFVDGAQIVAHNAEFDAKFLDMELLQAGFRTIDRTKVIDTLVLARRTYPGSANSLDALCARFKIDQSHREKHGALIDTMLLAEVYIELMGGRQKAFELPSKQKVKKIISATNLIAKPFYDRPTNITEEQFEAHSTYIQRNLKATFWPSA